MRLHLSSDCITINISEYSPYFLHVNQTLSQKFTKSFWVNDTLINFSTPKEAKKRKEISDFFILHMCSYLTIPKLGIFTKTCRNVR
ncbi:hypothetical protein Sdiek1_2556 [Sulfurospirillum diekertiae]|uniref:Uncharacterized protein n=1 Tax=Sulfurospirillum diekertiae TaxID=1854492 RepID=A0A1Y0HQ87_9BACT|nr:hypothetical protein Sdiek1_2556 [Sulfurospirillum diekertiae]